MAFGIAITSIIPMRDEACHQSEMVSQILFGEMFNIFEQKEEWSKIKLDFDGTEGWISNSMIQPLDATQYNELKSSTTIILDTISEIIVGNNSQSMRVMLGSELHVNGKQTNQMIIGDTIYSLKHRASIPMRGNIRHSVITKAQEYVYAPYLWGGRSLYGIDCSGFSQTVYKQNAITLPREVEDQFAVGRIIKDIEQAMPGDLAFFANSEGQICHVGIIIDSNRIIHASGYVRFAYLDGKSLFNIDEKTSKYTLVYIRNVID